MLRVVPKKPEPLRTCDRCGSQFSRFVGTGTHRGSQPTPKPDPFPDTCGDCCREFHREEWLEWLYS